MSSGPRAYLLLLALIPAIGCAPPPDTESGGKIGVVRLALVNDSYLFEPTVTQVVQLYILKAMTAAGGIACSDLRGQKFNPDDPRYEYLVNPGPAVPLGQHDPTKEIVFQPFEVPAGQKTIILVRGLTRYEGRIYPTGEGCQEDLLFDAGTSKAVNIDMTASTGADCGETTDCQVGLSCQRTPDKMSAFFGGYCVKSGCSGDQQCPPGTHCITDTASGNLCLRGCRVQRDCTYKAFSQQAVQECQGRPGPTAKGCGSICIFPTWNKDRQCAAE